MRHDPLKNSSTSYEHGPTSDEFANYLTEISTADVDDNRCTHMSSHALNIPAFTKAELEYEFRHLRKHMPARGVRCDVRGIAHWHRRPLHFAVLQFNHLNPLRLNLLNLPHAALTR